MNIKLPEILTQTCPKNMKLPKILMQYCPNNIKIARNFDTLKPSGGGGGGGRGQCPPGPPPPTPLPRSPQKCPVLGSRTALCFDWLKRKITKQKITKNFSFSIHFFPYLKNIIYCDCQVIINLILNGIV